MYQPGSMCNPQSAEQRPQHGDDGMRRHRAPLAQEFPQGASLDEFHHQERVCGVVALVVDGNQAGVLQARNRAGLTMESGEELVVTGIAGIHHLQCNRPAESNVEPAIDRRHSAVGNPGLNAITAVE